MHYEEYLASDPVQDGGIQNPMGIGEATKLILEQLKCEHTGISWREIAGMRGIPIHAHFGSVVRTYRMPCGMGSRNSRLQSGRYSTAKMLDPLFGGDTGWGASNILWSDKAPGPVIFTIQ